MTATRVLYRQALAYDLKPDGALVPRDLPARLVRAEGEGALYRRIADLAHEPDLAIAEAATRYGPLGPIERLPIGDPALFMLAWGEQFRQNMAGIGRLGRWIANGGRTQIPGELAPSAHLLCAMAETDADLMRQLLDLFAEAGPGLKSEEERELLGQAMDAQDEAILAALGRREPLLREQATKGAELVRVDPAPGTGRHLALAAQLLPVLVAKADEIGPPVDVDTAGEPGSPRDKLPTVHRGELPSAGARRAMAQGCDRDGLLGPPR